MAEYKSRFTGQEIDAGVVRANDAVKPNDKISKLQNDVGYLTEHQPLKTINDQSIIGYGNIVIEGGSGTSDYENLSNKPSINSVELDGNKSLEDLGIQPELISEVNIKTINGNSILGEGNLVIEGGQGGLSSVAHDETLTGAGTNESPLGISESVLNSLLNVKVIDATDPTQWEDFQPTQAVLEDIMTNDYDVLNLINTPDTPNIQAWFAEEQDHDDHGEITRIKKFYFFTCRGDGDYNDIILQVFRVFKTDEDPAEMDILDELMATKNDIPDISGKQDTLVSGTNIKTINNESILGSGNITIEGGGGSSTDVQINGTSITSSGTANIITEGTYNASSNKIATMSDLPDITGKQDTLVSGTNIKTINNQSILGSGDITIQGTQSQWAGVTIDFMGDSITEGYPGGSTVTKKYWEFLGEKLGATVYGYGIGGSTLADGQNPMWSRVLSMSSADLIFVFGGTNDFANYNRALGDQFTVSSGTRTLNVNTATFYGGLNKLCLNLIENYPNATYVLLTPIHRKNFAGQKTDLQANSAGLYLDAYVEAIKNVGKWFSIPVIDLYSEASLYPQDATQQTLYFSSSSDGLHPNTLGHQVLGDCIYHKLQGIHRRVSGAIYTITKTVTNGSASGASSITSTGTTSVTITPNTGYKLPNAITVTGASYTYNNNTGIISLSNATGNVTISAACTALASYTITKNVTGGSASGADSIYENGSAVITITPNANYYMPDSVTVSGASYTYNKANQTITISNPTGNVTITVACEYRAPEVYSITNSITGGTASGDSTITEGSTASVTITPNTSWLLPSTVTVVGATYSYDSLTGVISLSNPTGNVAITVVCTEIITYNISTSVTHGSYSGDTQITNMGTATVTITPSSGYYLPDTITVTSASYNYNEATGVITLSDAIGNVNITVNCTNAVPTTTWYSDTVTNEFIGSDISSYGTWFATGPFVGKSIYSGLDASHYPYPTQGSKINRIRFRAGKGAQTQTAGDGSFITDVNILVGKFNTSSKQITYLESIPITAANNIINSRNTISELAVTEFTIDANEKPFVYTSDTTKFMAYFSDAKNKTVQGLYYQLTPIAVGTPTVSELGNTWSGNLGIDYGYDSRQPVVVTETLSQFTDTIVSQPSDIPVSAFVKNSGFSEVSGGATVATIGVNPGNDGRAISQDTTTFTGYAIDLTGKSRIVITDTTKTPYLAGFVYADSTHLASHSNTEQNKWYGSSKWWSSTTDGATITLNGTEKYWMPYIKVDASPSGTLTDQQITDWLSGITIE